MSKWGEKTGRTSNGSCNRYGLWVNANLNRGADRNRPSNQGSYLAADDLSQNGSQQICASSQSKRAEWSYQWKQIISQKVSQPVSTIASLTTYIPAMRKTACHSTER